MKRLMHLVYIAAFVMIAGGGVIDLKGYDYGMVFALIEEEARALSFVIGGSDLEIAESFRRMLKEAELAGFGGEVVKNHHAAGRFYMAKLLFNLRIKYFVLENLGYLAVIFVSGLLSFGALKHFILNERSLNPQPFKLGLYTALMVTILSLTYLVLKTEPSSLIPILITALALILAGLVHFALLGFH